MNDNTTAKCPDLSPVLNSIQMLRVLMQSWSQIQRHTAKVTSFGSSDHPGSKYSTSPPRSYHNPHSETVTRHVTIWRASVSDAYTRRNQ